MIVERSVSHVSTEAFEILVRCRIRRVVVLPGRDPWDGSCGLSDCDSVTWTRLLVVSDVLVSPSSVVAEMCEGVSSDSVWEGVEPQSFSFSKERSFVCAENQRETSYEGSPVKAPPSTRRRMTPPTLQ